MKRKCMLTHGFLCVNGERKMCVELMLRFEGKGIQEGSILAFCHWDSNRDVSVGLRSCLPVPLWGKDPLPVNLRDMAFFHFS